MTHSKKSENSEKHFDFKFVDSEHIKIGGRTYGELSGFYYHFKVTEPVSETNAMIDQLFSENWIDNEVRKIALIFNIHEPVYNTYYSLLGTIVPQ